MSRRKRYRKGLRIFGYWCVGLASLFLAYASTVGWFFRDGLGPNSVQTSGIAAWLRFWDQFRFALLMAAPVLLFGLWCLFRTPKVTDEQAKGLLTSPPKKRMKVEL